VYLIVFFLILVSAKRQIDPHWITVVEEKKKTPKKREEKRLASKSQTAQRSAASLSQITDVMDVENCPEDNMGLLNSWPSPPSSAGQYLAIEATTATG
jgi:hypothetical protein